MRFLIVCWGDKTDVIFSTILIENLRAIFESAKIDFLVQNGTQDILGSHEFVNEVLTFEPINTRRSRLGQLHFDFSLALKIRKNRYENIFMPSESDSNGIVALLSRSKTRVVLNPKENIFKRLGAYTDTYEQLEPKHEIETKLDSLRAIGFGVTSKKTSLQHSDNATKNVKKLLDHHGVDKFVHVNLLCSNSALCPTDDFIANIVDFIEIEKSIKVVMTTSSSEYEGFRVFNALAKMKSRPIVLAGTLNDDEMIAFCKMSMLFVGINSYILHIASSQNIPTIAIFGPSDARREGPWDNQKCEDRFIKQASRQKVGAHTIIQSIRECVPCSQNGCENSGTSECFGDITIAQVKIEISENINI